MPSETNEEDLAELMVGREVSLVVDRGESHPADRHRPVEGLGRQGRSWPGGRPRHRPRIRAGEILGIAGVAGNGQDELVEAIVGLRKADGGRVTLGGVDITGKKSREIYESRRRLCPRRPPSVRAGAVVQHRRQPRPDQLPPPALLARACCATTPPSDEPPRSGSRRSTSGRPSADAKAATLSGGNQQKVVIAREFARDLRLLVLDQPTRGLDVGSIEFIHSRRSPSAMPGRPSCSCPPSSTRSSSCPTGSRSSIAAGWSACATGGPPTRTRSGC